LSVDEATVAGLRDANFGPLVEGSEMTHARQEIEALKREVVAFQKTIIDSASKLEQRLVAVVARLDNIKEPVNV
jgi:esterase/lipase